MVALTAKRQGFDLPSDGTIRLADFAALPEPPRGWAWELRSGRLELNHMPVLGWHWVVVLAALEYWKSLGHAVLGEQYVADSGFVRGGGGKHNVVADGVAFRRDREIDTDLGTHDVADVHVVIEAVSAGREVRDEVEKRHVYAELGVPHYSLIHRRSPHVKKDGLITMYELVNGAYKLAGTRLVSELTTNDER